MSSLALFGVSCGGTGVWEEKMRLHVADNSWCAECQWRSGKMRDFGLSAAYRAEAGSGFSLKRVVISSQGTWSHSSICHWRLWRTSRWDRRSAGRSNITGPGIGKSAISRTSWFCAFPVRPTVMGFGARGWPWREIHLGAGNLRLCQRRPPNCIRNVDPGAQAAASTSSRSGDTPGDF